MYEYLIFIIFGILLFLFINNVYRFSVGAQEGTDDDFLNTGDTDAGAPTLDYLGEEQYSEADPYFDYYGATLDDLKDDLHDWHNEQM